MERDASVRQRTFLEFAENQRMLRLGHHLLLVIGIIIAGIAGLTVVTWSEAAGFQTEHIPVLLIAVFVIILAGAERIRMTEKGCRTASAKAIGVIAWLKTRLHWDFLLFHYWIGWLLVGLPILIVLCHTAWTALSGHYQANGSSSDDNVRVLIPFVVAVLSAQVALFNFLFGQVLGRHSAGIASTVMSHPAIRLLQNSLIVILAILLLVGSKVVPELPRVSLVLAGAGTLAALLITLDITRKGMRIEQAIHYVGHVFAKTVLKEFKTPVTKLDHLPTVWRRVVGALGFDLADPHRLQVLVPPVRGTETCRNGLQSLVQVATKAIKDGEIMALSATLVAMSRVIDAYVSRRVAYLQEHDAVYSWLFDKLSGLMEEGENAADQNMLTELIKFTGFLGRVGLSIGDHPVSGNKTRRDRDTFNGPRLAFRCMNEIANAFRRGLSMERSTAASEALTQMRNLAIAANRADKPSVIREDYISQIEIVALQASKRKDAYGNMLLGEAASATLLVWLDYLLSEDDVGFENSLHEELAQLILNIATHANIEITLGTSLHDKIAVRLQPDQATIQDTVAALFSRHSTTVTKLNDTAAGIRTVIGTIGSLCLESIRSKRHGSYAYIDALYEVSFLVLKGLPSVSHGASEDESVDESWLGYSSVKKTPDELLVKELNEQWSGIISLILGNDRHHVMNWKELYLSYVGLCIAALAERGDAWLKDCVSAHLSWLLTQMQNATPNPGHPVPIRYLSECQLIGAWVDRVAPISDVAASYRKVVIEGRALHLDDFRSFGASHLNALGYPHFHFGDFSLPPIRSLSGLSQSDYAKLEQWNAVLTNPEMLDSYFKEILPEIRTRRAEFTGPATG